MFDENWNEISFYFKTKHPLHWNQVVAPLVCASYFIIDEELSGTIITEIGDGKVNIILVSFTT